MMAIVTTLVLNAARLFFFINLRWVMMSLDFADKKQWWSPSFSIYPLFFSSHFKLFEPIFLCKLYHIKLTYVGAGFTLTNNQSDIIKLSRGDIANLGLLYEQLRDDSQIWESNALAKSNCILEWPPPGTKETDYNVSLVWFRKTRTGNIWIVGFDKNPPYQKMIFKSNKSMQFQNPIEFFFSNYQSSRRDQS